MTALIEKTKRRVRSTNPKGNKWTIISRGDRVCVEAKTKRGLEFTEWVGEIQVGSRSYSTTASAFNSLLAKLVEEVS
jgi:hypothetical protein